MTGQMTELLPLSYPHELEHEVVLPDGARLTIRPIRPEDAPRLMEFHERLSRHTAYQRFFTVMKRLPPDWAHFPANVDYRRRLALVVEREPGELVAVARYEPTNHDDTAELAFVVQDGWQDRGLGTILLADLLRGGYTDCAIAERRAFCAHGHDSDVLCHWLTSGPCCAELQVDRPV